MSDINIVAPPSLQTPPLRARNVPAFEPANTRHLRLLSYNIQIGISAKRFRHYLTHSWRHVLPHPESFENLDRIGQISSDFDIVALQETDAGSFRSYFINQVEYLAKKGRFPFWCHQTTRNLGRFAQHSMGLLSKYPPQMITEHKLPGFIPGRGVMEVRFGNEEAPLILLQVHLALGRRARLRQLEYISDLVNAFEHVVVMGDFNCKPKSREMDVLLNKTSLSEPIDKLNTFPSWKPIRNIDHVLVTPTIKIMGIQVLSHAVSDHLPIAVNIALPDKIELR